MTPQRVLTSLFILTATLTTRAADAPTTRLSPEMQLDTAIDATFDGMTIEEVLRSIAERYHVNLVPDWSNLEAGEVRRTKTLRGRVTGLSLHATLQAAFAEAGWQNQIRLTVDDGLIRISGEHIAQSRVYDVAKLLEMMKKSYPTTQPSDQVDVGDKLNKLIQDHISPDSWREQGGSEGTINVIGTRLIVQQSAKNIAKLETFLRELETPRAR